MLALLHIVTLLPGVLAGTSVHYFRNPSCDFDGLGAFTDSISATDTACHVSPHNITKAIYIDNIDDDCAVITYSDYQCSPGKARHKLAERELCFFSIAGGLLRSWKNVCGLDLAAASASFASIRATAVHSTTAVSQWSATSYSLTTITSTSTWQTWNGVMNTTFSSTMTQTKSIPVQATIKTGHAECIIIDRVLGAIATVLAIGGVMLVSM